MSVADFAQGLFLRWPRLPSPGLTQAETGGRPPRRRSGPVLMGDIHGALGGRPVLLLQWERWEREAAKGDDT